MIAIVAAMSEEVQALAAYMDQKEMISINDITMWRGLIHERDVVLMQSGVGKVSAAMSLTCLLKEFDIHALINIGTAGGLSADEQVLDLVIGKTIVQYDYDTSYLDGEAGLGKSFRADLNLCEQCECIAHDMNERCHSGLMLSGDQFIGKDEQITALLKRYPSAKCAEMESGAIAQVCTHFGVPFVIVRSLSDIAFQEKSNLSFLEYVTKASARSALFCVKLIQRL